MSSQQKGQQQKTQRQRKDSSTRKKKMNFTPPVKSSKSYKTFFDGQIEKDLDPTLPSPQRTFLKFFPSLLYYEELSVMDAYIYCIIHNIIYMKKNSSWLGKEKIKAVNKLTKEKPGLARNSDEFKTLLDNKRKEYYETPLTHFSFEISNAEIEVFLGSFSRMTLGRSLKKLQDYGLIDFNYIESNRTNKVRLLLDIEEGFPEERKFYEDNLIGLSEEEIDDIMKNGFNKVKDTGSSNSNNNDLMTDEQMLAKAVLKDIEVQKSYENSDEEKDSKEYKEKEHREPTKEDILRSLEKISDFTDDWDDFDF